MTPSYIYLILITDKYLIFFTNVCPPQIPTPHFEEGGGGVFGRYRIPPECWIGLIFYFNDTG